MVRRSIDRRRFGLSPSIPSPARHSFRSLVSLFALCLLVGDVVEAVPANAPRPSAPLATLSPSSVPLYPAVCPQVLRCDCANGTDPSRVHCRQITNHEIEQLSLHYPSLSILSIAQWAEHALNLSVFSSLESLVDLKIQESDIRQILPSSKPLKRLRNLDLSGSSLRDSASLCNLTASISRLHSLSLSSTNVPSIEACVEKAEVEWLDLSNNKLSVVSALPASLIAVDLSNNRLSSLLNLPAGIQRADLSSNPLTQLGPSNLQALHILNLSYTLFSHLPSLESPVLKEVDFGPNMLIYADFTLWKTPSLNKLSMRDATRLELVHGKLPPAVENFELTNSELKDLPRDFFKDMALSSLRLEGNRWDCEPCRFLWSEPVHSFLESETCPNSTIDPVSCELGCKGGEEEIVRTRYGSHAVLPCGCWGYPEPQVEWFLYRPKAVLGTFDPLSNTAQVSHNGSKIDGKYQVLANGLLFPAVDRSLVERYVCVVRNEHGTAYRIIRFRLDYSHWYSLDVFDSVFWGCLLTSFLVCAFSFLLNIIWILSRTSILWWIKRAERLSRVRKMVEAMEKYRARQMEALHESYSRKVQNVRDNYHHQVEQIRQTYASQAERFRDYRAARLENVQSHLETIRDNYNQQMQRVREYGSRRAEQLWESYERQVNRMRTFSLQHRLKLMRQYKVKQRYLNKLLESFQDAHSPEAMRKHEEEVRAALDALKEGPLEGVPEEPEEEDDTHGPGHHPLSRASSFYSLPEYILDENGQLRPAVIPTVRFHHRDELRPRAGPSGSLSAEPTPKRTPQPDSASDAHSVAVVDGIGARAQGDRKSAPTSTDL